MHHRGTDCSTRVKCASRYDDETDVQSTAIMCIKWFIVILFMTIIFIIVILFLFVIL